MVEPLTPEQTAAVCRVMGVKPAGGNPYASTRGPDLIRHYESYEAHETFSERRRDVRFDDLYSDREMGLWADLQHFKARSERLEAEIREACKILQTDSLVVAVRKLVAEVRELKQKGDQ